MPKQRDTITQTELAAVVAAHRLTYTLIWNLRQRLLNGVRPTTRPKTNRRSSTAWVCREPGHCELLTPTAAAPGLFFPVRALYIELPTLRAAQHVFTEDAWRKACRVWKQERRSVIPACNGLWSPG